MGRDNLEAKVSEFQRYCSTPGSDFRQKAQDLYKELSGSVLNELPKDANLLVVPSGPLFNVPFCALMDGDEFLIARFPVCTLPCVSLIQYWAIRKTGPGRLVLGNSRGDLPAATEEAKTVARLLNAAPLLQQEVIRHDIERQVSVCSFIHIACHATMDELVPGFSGFTLANGAILSAQDLASAQLNCRLAFLSACNSGRVASRFEDDPLSIGVSFLAAGAQAVIFTLWEINDFATKDLIVNFYERMLKGFSLNRALRDAQLSLLKRKRYSHPHFWAAFQLTESTGRLVSLTGERYIWLALRSRFGFQPTKNDSQEN